MVKGEKTETSKRARHNKKKRWRQNKEEREEEKQRRMGVGPADQTATNARTANP
jgi:hypothetical protein